MRSIWKGVISFGLVNIPVRLYSAANPEEYDFHYLHAKDMSRIGFARKCKAEDVEVPFNEIVKGHEMPDGSYVVMTDEDFAKANVEKTNKIQILHFSKEREVETPYFEAPYYLEPQKDSHEPYAILRQALQDSKSVGVVRYVLRTREHIGVLKVWKGALIVNQMRYAAEVREPEGLQIPKEMPTPEGLEMAMELVQKMTKPFNVNDHKDLYKEEIARLIEAKAKGQTIEVTMKAPRATPASDLMLMLKKSLEESK